MNSKILDKIKTSQIGHYVSYYFVISLVSIGFIIIGSVIGVLIYRVLFLDMNRENRDRYNVEIIKKHIRYVDDDYERRVVKVLVDYFEGKCYKEYRFRAYTLAKLVQIATAGTGVDPTLVAPIIVYESGCNSVARNSDSGAFGLMQIHPIHKPSYFINDLENIIRGTEILSDCLVRYKDLRRGLECYGAGEVNLVTKSYNDFVYDILNKIIRDYDNLKQEMKLE